MNVTLVCPYCKKTFSGKAGRKYCSHPCYLIGQKRPLIDRFWEKVEKTDTCWLWIGVRVPSGYGILQEGTRPISHSAHRLSYQLHVGPIPNGMRVCHTCDTVHCVNPAHLFLGTAKDNSQDMVKKGRSGKGERNAMSKLTTNDVKTIRHLYFSGTVTQKALAKQYSVGQATISNITNRRLWPHVT